MKLTFPTAPSPTTTHLIVCMVIDETAQAKCGDSGVGGKGEGELPKQEALRCVSLYVALNELRLIDATSK